MSSLFVSKELEIHIKIAESNLLMNSELGFEQELISYLQEMQKNAKKQWQYRPELKTLDDLWNNFRHILETNNRDKLERPLSENEFNQVKNEIERLETPYDAGKFLYGLNGVSQIEVKLDDSDKPVHLTVFDQNQVGAGNTVYEVVNQIQSPAKIPGRENRRFDVTLLINGLPIIHIEEKRANHNVKEALNQMHKYIKEKHFQGIYSTVQILVALSENDGRYMANAEDKYFNTDFAFQWQDEKTNKPVRDWRTFVRQMLSIPMGHKMATNYMILDGSKDKNMLKVMRPYQVYATRNVLDKIDRHDFTIGGGNKKLGYVWHTTGSGKTISSFKTAWLASGHPKVDKVVFLVDRIALTNQTAESYRAYDPENELTVDSINGIVSDTSNVYDLWKKLNSKSKKDIIVTSVQKLNKLVDTKHEELTKYDKHILFIVDEAHRSTGSENFSDIQKAFKYSAWVGYTGTPMFESKTERNATREIFGDLLHAYTIKEAIADDNVLGFKVDFQTTISKDEMTNNYLPKFYHAHYPNWTEDDIQYKIKNLTTQDIDDQISPSFYDENEEHVKEVVKDIFKYWKARSVNGKYNALLTTRVGGNRVSVPMAMMYYDEFKKYNAELIKAGKADQTLKVGITFSLNTSNNDHMNNTNEALARVIDDYNQMFDTSFDLTDVSAYTEDLATRLRRKSYDKKYLDLVIVVDQLLTGFDAPQMNTLYVDRILRDANLIQAYSRTNRIYDMNTKQFGRIVNYRWPEQNKKLMEEAIAVYSNRDSANTQTVIGDGDEGGNGVGPEPKVLVDEAKEIEEAKDIIIELRELTDDFTDIPKSEKQQDAMVSTLRTFVRKLNAISQFDAFTDNRQEMLEKIGLTEDQEELLRGPLRRELETKIRNRNETYVDFELNLEMVLVEQVEINYDYITELLAEIANGDMSKIPEVEKELAKGDNSDSFVEKIYRFIDRLKNGYLKDKRGSISAKDIKKLINESDDEEIKQLLQDFCDKWGIWGIIDTVISLDDLRDMLLDAAVNLNQADFKHNKKDIAYEAGKVYLEHAKDEQVLKLTTFKYVNEVKAALRDMAKKIFRLK